MIVFQIFVFHVFPNYGFLAYDIYGLMKKLLLHLHCS